MKKQSNQQQQPPLHIPLDTRPPLHRQITHYQRDLACLADWRWELGQQCQAGYAAVNPSLLEEYAVGLQLCHERLTTAAPDQSRPGATTTTTSSSLPPLQLDWSSGTVTSLQQERDKVLCNRGLLLAHEAQQHNNPQNASLLYQQAAGWCYSDFTLRQWCLGQAQQSALQHVAAQPRPPHVLLAKLAQAAKELFPQTSADYRQMTVLSHYHQSLVHQAKQESDLELARLEVALDHVEESSFLAKTLQERKEHLLARGVTPCTTALPAIPAQRTVQEPQGQTLPDHVTLPLFAEAPSEVAPQDPPKVYRKEKFRGDDDDMEAMLASSSSDEEEEKIEVAPAAVANPLWARVQQIQQDNVLAQLQQDLWNLCELSEATRQTHQQMVQQLDENVRLDRAFRTDYPNYSGHHAKRVQTTFSQTLDSYASLLAQAQDGDALLLRRLELLEQDPKFKLLQFEREQLDRYESSWTLMEEAVDELDGLQRHLKEGRSFYHRIGPKLKSLEKQAGDLSARLTVERCEYQDRHERSAQLEADARMAAQWHNDETAPVLEQSKVDDEKVASLVAMDFDPEKVVQALEKHDNDVELALNELLSGSAGN